MLGPWKLLPKFLIKIMNLIIFKRHHKSVQSYPTLQFPSLPSLFKSFFWLGTGSSMVINRKLRKTTRRHRQRRKIPACYVNPPVAGAGGLLNCIPPHSCSVSVLWKQPVCGLKASRFEKEERRWAACEGNSSGGL